MRLRFKLFLPLAAFLVMFIVYVKGSWLPELTKLIKQEHRTHLQNHLRSIGESLVPLLLQQQLATIHDTLDSLKEANNSWKSIVLRDKKGKVLYPVTSVSVGIADRDNLVIKQNIDVYTRKIATLELQVNDSAYLEKLTSFETYFMIVLMMLLILIVMTILGLLEWVVSYPLRVLAQASEQLADGNYSVELPKPYKDEVGNLISTFDSMRNALSSYHVQVEYEINGHKKTTTELRKQKERLAYYASHDSLTGLLNRREFDLRLDAAIISAKEQTAIHAMLFIDMDRFKMVNDTCGHLAGDELLKQMSTLISHHVKETDSIARLGGDEFAILIEFSDKEKVETVVDQLHRLIQNFTFSWYDKAISVGASIGVTFINTKTIDMEEVLTASDRACYIAKKQGRNRYVINQSNEADDSVRSGQGQLVSNLVQALEAERFVLYAQPIQALDEDNLREHYEVLVRMIDGQGNVVLPGAFIPLAERYNLMIQLDKWVVRNTLKSLERLNAAGVDAISLSVNLSGISVSDPEMLDFLSAQIESHAVNACDICFEITETAAISDIVNAQNLITKLKSLGCEFSLDDFGSGFSSFSYMKNLPMDYLKIDGQFVSGILDDPMNAAIVQSINDIGKVFGMRTIAEFVENQAILERIKDLGVDYAQGFHIARPAPLDDLIPSEVKVKVKKGARNSA